MNRRLRIAAWAGLALIVATNAVALAGAAYNRSGEPQAALKLTERELNPPYVWNDKSENSGLSLKLNWRVLQSQAPTRHGRRAFYASTNHGWLDGAKMRELGFDTAPALPTTTFDHAPRHVALPRDVFIVLELDGPAYQEYVRRAEAAAADKSEWPDTERPDTLDQARHLDTRLFAIDAGLDAAALRARYPDRKMFAIVRGRVQPHHNGVDGDAGGFIDELTADEINVPLALRPVFDGVEREGWSNRSQPTVHFEATVMFGQRAEPWLAAAERR